MRDSLLALLAAGTMHAAVIRGVVVEHSTGKPLARSQLVVAPLPGTPGQPRALRSNTYGNFEVDGLPAGGYLISAARRGFPPVQYGQKNWRAAGTPVLLAEDQSIFLNVRMPRYGAITGMVVDENDVGIPDHEVVAYRYAKPPRLMARATADERGIFRIAGLDPGRYLVRTVARMYEEGGYLPTFYRDTMRVDDAIFMDVDLDRDVGEARVRAFPGRLHSVSGVITCILPPGAPPPPSIPVTVTLVSDVGRETATTGCPGGFFKFSNKPPGPYELYAATQDGQGAFIAFTLEEHDWENTFPLLPMANVSVSYRGQQGKFIDPSSVALQMRRVDLAGESPIEKQKITTGRTQLVQARWQFQLVPNPTYVATDFRGCRNERSEGGRADGWNEVLINLRVCGIVYTLSNKPSTVRGLVSTNGHEPVPGAPVFLEPWDAMNRKRLGEPRTVRSDQYGKYELIGLAPGTYRLVSTFEYLNPEAMDIDNMLPRTITVEEGRDQQQDIDLFVIR
jgi:hypothetical protein